MELAQHGDADLGNQNAIDLLNCPEFSESQNSANNEYDSANEGDDTFNIARDLMSNKKHMNPVLPQLENLSYYADIVNFTDTSTYCQKLRTLGIEVEELSHDGYGYTISRPIWVSNNIGRWRELFDKGGKYHTSDHFKAMRL